MKIGEGLTAAALQPAVMKMFALATAKTALLEQRWEPAKGAPVFTQEGRYTARGWTQWTQGFQYGNALLCFDATGDAGMLKLGRDHTLADMAEHVSHTGVHDHGFNNVSTYGNLRRLMLAGRLAANEWELRFYELALKTSGAVQAARWTALPGQQGFIHSFNGPHSLFVDTLRTLRVCALAHGLGHALLGEQDERINLLFRLLRHARATATYNVFYGEGRDGYDRPELCGRTAHETIFNTVNGSYRCPSSQQGHSPFSTWTRGLAWAMLGFAEQFEFISALAESGFGHADAPMTKREALTMLQRAACATCDFYLAQAAAADGICYWDTGAQQLHCLGDWRSRAADPFNDYEPVDASASAIAAQGLIRLGRALDESGAGKRYLQAGLAVARTLLAEPYLSTSPQHEGILLHSVYHQPNGWDYVPRGQKVPSGESSMWGDYHLLELGLLVAKIADGGYYTFFGIE